jgi:hypothetical protein
MFRKLHIFDLQITEPKNATQGVLLHEYVQTGQAILAS